MAIRSDSTLTCSDLQTFSKLTDLQSNSVPNYPYATYEPSYWLLDGNFKFMPTVTSQIHVGLMSLSQSDANGDFATPPELIITFSQEWDTDDLTLIFAQNTPDWASQVEIAYYDDGDVLIQSGIFAPTDSEFSTGQACSGFAKLVIRFLQTNNPYRYARLQALNYGELITFTSADIKSCQIVEEINPISAELPIGTLNLTLRTDRFSIVDPAGDFANLQNWQPMDVYEIVDGAQVYIGQYYLENWKNKGETEIEFSAVDVLGVLDAQEYLGTWYYNAAPSFMLNLILAGTNIMYDIDPAIEAKYQQGWIPIGTIRQALQSLAFAYGGYINVTRSGIIQLQETILPADVTTYDFAITKAQKGIKQELSLKPLVTKVEILSHNYYGLDAEYSIFSGDLDAGQYTFRFEFPVRAINSITAPATIVSSGTNQIVINVPSTMTVTILAQNYLERKTLYSVENGSLPAGTKPNVVKIHDAYQVSSEIAQATAQRIYDYYQHRYLQKVRLYAPECAPGDIVTIETWQGKTIAGIVEKMSSDLAGGFVVDAEISGVILP